MTGSAIFPNGSSDKTTKVKLRRLGLGKFLPIAAALRFRMISEGWAEKIPDGEFINPMGLGQTRTHKLTFSVAVVYHGGWRGQI